MLQVHKFLGISLVASLIHWEINILLSYTYQVILTYMQFLAAKSLCTKRLEERYSIPLAISRHIFISKL